MTKKLEHSARRGDLIPAFELFQKAIDGDDHVNSQEWLSLCWNYLERRETDKDNASHPENLFRLRAIALIDFRRFSRLNLRFEDDLTIIIGNNGQGKTSILSAIAKTLSWFSANILKADSSGQRLNEFSDIRNGAESQFTDVISHFSFGQGLKNIPVRLSRAAPGTAERRDGEIKEAKGVGDIWRVVNAFRTINLPVFAFYGVERSHPYTKTKTNAEKRDERFDAYTNALTGAGRFDHFVDWFIYLHKKTGVQQNSDLHQLQEQVSYLEKAVINGLEAMKPLLLEAQHKLKFALTESANQSNENTLSDADQMAIVSSSITQVVPSISRIWVETASGSDVIRVINDDLDVTVDQLSDGQRVFLGLVADLARRITMLNPLRSNPLEGQGIVLIDEVELHLHPKWQQEVVPRLRAVFPNIQFIITTHSPIVLSTTDKRCIREFVTDLDSGEETLHTPSIQTKGSENAEILEQVMDVFSTPQNIAETHLLSEFEASMSAADDTLSSESLELYQKIQMHFGLQSSQIKKADNLIRLNKLKSKIRKAVPKERHLE